MREIKFRAYHKKLNKLFTVKGIDWLCMSGGTCELSTIHLVKLPGEGYDKSGILCRPDEIELLQFTGLNDKNGKEIYEGYFVKAPFDDLDEYKEIYFAKGVFGYGGFITPLSEFHSEDLEVAGNIYENPELNDAEQKDGE